MNTNICDLVGKKSSYYHTSFACVDNETKTNNSAIEAFCATRTANNFSAFPNKCYRIVEKHTFFQILNVKKTLQYFFVVLSRFENISNMSIPPAVVSCWKPSSQ